MLFSTDQVYNNLTCSRKPNKKRNQLDHVTDGKFTAAKKRKQKNNKRNNCIVLNRNLTNLNGT